MASRLNWFVAAWPSGWKRIAKSRSGESERAAMSDARSGLGPVELVTAATLRSVSLDEFKSQQRIDGSDEDSYLLDLIASAERYVERRTGRQLLTATFDVRITRWWNGRLKLPRPPLASVTGVYYYDTAGTETTVTSSDYIVRTPQFEPGTIERAPSATWPVVEADRLFPIRVRFVAGATSGANVSAELRHLVRLVASHWYANREGVVIGTIATEVPQGIDALVGASDWGSYS